MARFNSENVYVRFFKYQSIILSRFCWFFLKINQFDINEISYDSDISDDCIRLITTIEMNENENLILEFKRFLDIEFHPTLSLYSRYLSLVIFIYPSFVSFFHVNWVNFGFGVGFWMFIQLIHTNVNFPHKLHCRWFLWVVAPFHCLISRQQNRKDLHLEFKMWVGAFANESLIISKIWYAKLCLLIYVCWLHSMTKSVTLITILTKSANVFEK